MRYRDLDKPSLDGLQKKYKMTEYEFKIELCKIIKVFNDAISFKNMPVKNEVVLFSSLIMLRLSLNKVLSFKDIKNLLIQSIKDFKWEDLLEKELFIKEKNLQNQKKK